MSIAFSWKPMLWDAQGGVMRGRGGGASQGRGPFIRGRLGRSHSLTLPRGREGYPIQ